MIFASPATGYIDPAERVARLERRLAREREARLEAERIAEQGLLDLFSQKERLRLLETIATAVNHSDDPAEAFEIALKEICAFTGWPLGHVWNFADDDPSTLVCAGLWRGAEAPRMQVFRHASTSMRFTRGIGLPGRVMETGRAVWIEDIVHDSNFCRAREADLCGLRGAFALPALIGDEVGAVLEFFQHSPEPPDADLLETLNQIGAQLGRAVERYRASREMQRRNEELLDLFAEAQAQREAAEAADRAKSAFLAVTSHEIRTPLNAVLGLSEALKREALTPRQAELNAGVLASGQMLLRLLNAVLDMSKIEAEQAILRLDDFDVAEKLGVILSIWKPHAEGRGRTLSVELMGLEANRVRSDEGRIEQTLVNLLSNALKFTPEGGHVRVVASGSRSRLRFEVIDGGTGVDEADRESIFKAFIQTAEGREAGGAGLGLSICAGNVALLGGAIGADRTVAGESRFWFECPVEPVESERVVPEAETVANDGAGGLAVLAAEDNPANRRVLEMLLAPLGVSLTLVENGQEAVDMLRVSRFDLILMDANMPVMDGVTAVRRIREENLAHGAALHMLTANAFADDVARYMAAGADGVLTKPIELPKLFAVLAACVHEEEEPLLGAA